MYLYLGESPRSLYLVTSSQDEKRGTPSRALVFRAAQDSSSQAVVEFLPKSEVDLTNATRLSSRIVKGCLGLISIAGGMSTLNVCPCASRMERHGRQICLSQSSRLQLMSETQDPLPQPPRVSARFTTSASSALPPRCGTNPRSMENLRRAQATGTRMTCTTMLVEAPHPRRNTLANL